MATKETQTSASVVGQVVFSGAGRIGPNCTTISCLHGTVQLSWQLCDHIRRAMPKAKLVKARIILTAAD